MGLDQYRKMRRFQETPEPRGAANARATTKPLRFVVQEHHARRLHYDFRLEIDGTLKSWAVPKGPPVAAAERRLAVQTEDHPLEYGKFEGVIPKGHYGAGAVKLWDQGTFSAEPDLDRAQSEKQLRAGLKSGKIHFYLSGDRLRGKYSLVRLQDDRTWLLLKSRAEGSGKAREAKLVLPRKKAPALVKPMLATLVDEPFDDPNWVFEVKWDGYRALATKDGDDVHITSRNGKSFLPKYQELVPALRRLKKNAVVDGEVVVLGDQGQASFQKLQLFEKTGEGTLVYYVFDVLSIDGEDVTALPLLERKKRLKALLPNDPSVRFSDHVEARGKEFFQVAAAQGLEGMMAKDGTSRYVTGVRTDAWRKVKTHRRQEVVIAGFTEPKGSRKHLGALYLGVYQNGELVPVGHVGTGFDQRLLRDLSTRLHKIERKNSPFARKVRTNGSVHWVQPKLVAEVRFQEWTDDGHLRQPVFEGLRQDKAASSVQREHSIEEKAVKKAVATGRVKLTHTDKVYWPKEGITKGDLLAYYRTVAPVILPHLRGRPESLHRHPDGIEGESFFQKNATQKLPPWVPTTTVNSASTGGKIRYLRIEDEDSLLYVVNLGCIELNPWFSRKGSLGKPDYLVIDLDPEDIAFGKVVEAALAVRKVLDAAELESFPKTSGATGLHIYVPLGAQYSFEEAKTFAELVANIVHQRLPKTTSVVRNPRERQQRVYLDYLQNRRGQTLAAPYCIRPRPGATVSTPLRWSEVTSRLDPRKFDRKTTLRRIEKLGDLFLPVLERTSDLRGAVERLTPLATR